MEQSYKDAITGQSAGSSRAQGVDMARDSGTSAWGVPLGRHSFHLSSDTSLFSSSLPVFPHQTLNYSDPEPCGQSVDDSIPKLTKLVLENEGKDPLEDGESNAIGSILPDDEEELLAGIMNDLDLSGFPSQLEDLEDYDLFGSGGGMELDFESQENHSIGIPKSNLNDGIAANGISQYALANGLGAVAGEHPYGEHPSRTLFVRNINSNVEDSELISLFEQYGDIRTLYTACKHRGFVMISYFDIRDARAAMRALQNKPLRRRKLDIHFSIPKDNPSEKDINQGTLVIFNLDPSVSNDELRQIFGVHGEIKEIRETPHKRHHKFIEFYDVRAAEAALRALNKSDIAGKRIKLEPSRPGGARRNFMQQLNHEFEQDEAWSFRQQIGSPRGSSPPGNWPQFGSPVEHNLFHGLSKSPGLGTFSPVKGSSLPGLASLLPLHLSNPAKIAPIGRDQSRANQVNPLLFTTGTMQGITYQHSHSFPDQKLSTNPAPAASGVSNATSHGIGTLSGPQFLWGSPTLYSERSSSSAWPTSSFTSRQGSPLGAHQHHHVGSAPSGVPLDRHFGFFPESPDTTLASPLALGGIGVNCNSGSYMMNVGARGPISAGIGHPGKISENGSPSLRMMSLPRYSSLFVGNGSYGGPGINRNDALFERSRSGRIDSNMIQTESKIQYQLDLEKIIIGEDTRTTLMIKNIPNKYTSKMLLAAIDEGHSGTYDFLYLPIDFKNKCNVGYAFINMISPAQIIPFYKAFNGKKWDKFNSEKVASLAYARIQGKAALVAHFQNSSLMNEDKWCRPILFQSEGHELSDQENFLSENLNIYIRQPDGSYSGDLLESPRGQS